MKGTTLWTSFSPWFGLKEVQIVCITKTVERINTGLCLEFSVLTLRSLLWPKVTVSFKCFGLCEILRYLFQKIDKLFLAEDEWLAVNLQGSILSWLPFSCRSILFKK